MNNVYSEEHIKTIKNYIKTNAYATNYVTPSINLIITLTLLFASLYLITIANNYYALTILVLVLALILMKMFMIYF